VISFKRKIYKRGSSFETTLPSPLLFTLDSSKKYFVVFKFDSSANKWYVEFEENKGNSQESSTETNTPQTKKSQKTAKKKGPAK